MSNVNLDIKCSDTKVHPGQELQVTCAVEPWTELQEKVQSIELELGYDSEVLSTSNEGGITDNYVAREGPVHVKAGQLTIPRSQLEPSGTCTVTLAVPPLGPPSSLGFRTAKWSIAAKLCLKHALGREFRCPIEVLPLAADEVLAARQQIECFELERGGHSPYAWLSEVQQADLDNAKRRQTPERICLILDPDDEDSAAEPLCARDLTLSLDSPTTARNDVISGKIALRPDPLGFASSKIYLTKRGERKTLEKADASRVECSSCGVTLQCFRVCGKADVGSSENYRAASTVGMYEERQSFDLPRELGVGTLYEVPFEVKVPTSAQLGLDGKQWKRDNLLPPTHYGRQLIPEDKASPRDDSFLWRLVARAEAKTDRGFKYWMVATTEVVIT